jgi:hypothetical protein
MGEASLLRSRIGAVLGSLVVAASIALCASYLAFTWGEEKEKRDPDEKQLASAGFEFYRDQDFALAISWKAGIAYFWRPPS